MQYQNLDGKNERAFITSSQAVECGSQLLEINLNTTKRNNLGLNKFNFLFNEFCIKYNFDYHKERSVLNLIRAMDIINFETESLVIVSRLELQIPNELTGTYIVFKNILY